MATMESRIDSATVISCDGAASFYVESTISTMDEARRLSSQVPEGHVRAGVQSAGRGRLPDRKWFGEPGESILVTFWFPADSFGKAPLPLLAGLALVRACDSWAQAAGARFRDSPRLKWPNDALCGDRKLAGVLCEASGPTLYAGIGVNCRQTTFPPGLRTTPTSVFLETGMYPEPNDFIHRIESAFSVLREAGGSWKNEYETMLAWRGHKVRFTPGKDLTPVDGILRGVDTTGALILAPDGCTPGDTTAWHSGELSLVIDEGGRT